VKETRKKKGNVPGLTEGEAPGTQKGGKRGKPRKARPKSDATVRKARSNNKKKKRRLKREEVEGTGPCRGVRTPLTKLFLPNGKKDGDR